MTQVANRKTKLRFETSDTVRGRAVMVEVEAFMASVRLKGTRTSYPISWAGIYWLAAKAAADEVRRNRQGRKS